MMPKKRKNPAEIEKAIAALEVELTASREAEKARKWDELARLLKCAGALDDALVWARSRNTNRNHDGVKHDQ